MSVFSLCKTFFEEVGAELKKLFKSTAWEQAALAVVTYVAPIAEGILTFADPAIEPLVANVVNVVKSDLATISVVVKQGTAAPGSPAAVAVTTALNSINTNLRGLLEVAEVKNSTKIAEITAAVNTITNEVDAALAALPA